MRTLLALVIAASSAVVGAVLGRSRRPAGPIAMPWVMVVAALGALVAELSTILWVGAPLQVWQPAIGGALIGVVSGVFSGRKRRPPED